MYNFNQPAYPPFAGQNRPIKQKRGIDSYEMPGYQPIYSPYAPNGYAMNQGLYNGYYGNNMYPQYDSRTYQHPYYPFESVSHYSPTLPDTDDFDPEILDSAELEGSILDDKSFKVDEKVPSRSEDVTTSQIKQ